MRSRFTSACRRRRTAGSGVCGLPAQFYTLFTRSGLERLCGPACWTISRRSLSSRSRPRSGSSILLAMAQRIRSGDITGRIVEPGVFPDYLSMTTSQQSGVGFYTTAHFPMQDGFYAVQIREPALCRAFLDWLTHLPSGRQTLGAEETAQALEALARGI